MYLITLSISEDSRNSNLHGPTIIVRIMEVFELWRFNSIISLQGTKNKDRIRESSNYRGSNYGDSTVFTKVLTESL